MCGGWWRRHSITACQILLSHFLHPRTEIQRGSIRSWARRPGIYEFVADDADEKNGRHNDCDEYGWF
jgi:hypothetical protein